MSARRARRFRTLAVLLAALSITVASAPAASAEPAIVTGGESTLLVNFTTVLHLGEDNIYASVVPPATLSGLTFSAYFPITGGAIETTDLLGSVNHAGGLVIYKYNDDQTMVENELETTNLKIVNGNTLVGDVGGIIPAPSSDLVNATITPGAGGTVLYQADVNVSATAAPVLNTYFDTDRFTPGLNLGRLNSIIETQRHPRPGGASPLSVPLVPVYAPCTSPNTSHVAPLDAGSCTPAELQSSILTTSTIGTGLGGVRLQVQPGNVLTAEDEADVAVNVSATDVRRQSDGSDYVGRVALAATLRVTDRTGGGAGGLTVTVQDFPFGLPILCAATPGPAGSSCNLNTTLDTLVPGFAVEGERAVVSILDLSLNDPGADGQIPVSGCPPACGSGDERPFLRQGVFAP